MTGYGLVTAASAELYQRSLGININLVWGLVLLVFGAVMLLLHLARPQGRGQRACARQVRPARPVPGIERRRPTGVKTVACCSCV